VAKLLRDMADSTSPVLDGRGGVYCENNNISPVAAPDEAGHGHGQWRVGVAPHAIDPAIADALWDLSQQLTGVRRR
jgi:hypothetical protein